MTQEPMPSPASTASDDYAIVRRLVAALAVTPAGPAALASAAARMGLSASGLDALLHRWGGLDAAAFARAASPGFARTLVADGGLLAPAPRRVDLPVAVTEARRVGHGVPLSLHYVFRPSPFGDCLVLAAGDAVAAVGFVDEDRPSELADMRRRWPSATIEPGNAALERFADRIFDPGRWQTPFPVALLGTDFDRTVWQAMLAIPLGGATTYSELAAGIGRPRAARAVGAAVGRNPVSFLVPCHRVVGRSGALTGYYWGTARKQAMLAWEAGLTGTA